MEYILSQHAKEKVFKRKIPLELIESVLEMPEQILVQDGKKILQSLVQLNNKEYLLRIFVNVNREPNVIITVYMTDKISKYWSLQ